jgi:hypothetical protein
MEEIRVNGAHLNGAGGLDDSARLRHEIAEHQRRAAEARLRLARLDTELRAVIDAEVNSSKIRFDEIEQQYERAGAELREHTRLECERIVAESRRSVEQIA